MTAQPSDSSNWTSETPSETITLTPNRPETTSTNQSEPDALDLVADPNAEDGDGLGWSTLDNAVASDRVRPGAMLLAGNPQAQAVVRVVAVDDHGPVHFAILPGPVEKNRHLLDCTVA
ncbi:hypothetical protein BH18ACT3_BH18ACT3_07180 [soil metagenome]